MTQPNYGTDWSCTTDLDRLGRVVSGEELMAEALVRRAITRQGSLVGAPLYGLGLLDLLNEETSPNELQIIAARMAAEFKKDERVLDCTVTARMAADLETFEFEVTATSAEGPFQFTLTSDAVTVALLNVGG